MFTKNLLSEIESELLAELSPGQRMRIINLIELSRIARAAREDSMRKASELTALAHDYARQSAHVFGTI